VTSDSVTVRGGKFSADLASSSYEGTTSGVDEHGLFDEIKSNGSSNGSCFDHSPMDIMDDGAINLKVSANGIQQHLELIASSEHDISDVIGSVSANGKTSGEQRSCVRTNGDLSKVVADSSSAVSFQNTLPEQNQNWIGAQILALPRDVANSLNLSRPITVRFNNRSIIVPSSCISLTAEGAKVLLPPNTLSPPSVSQLSEAMDCSAKLVENAANSNLKSDCFSNEEAKLAADTNNSLHHRSPGNSVAIGVDLSHNRTESENLTVKESSVSKYGKEIAGSGIEILDSNLDCMLHVLGYLDMMDLIRVSEVCERWRDISRHKLLVSTFTTMAFHNCWNLALLLTDVGFFY
jgi:F-box-like